MGYIIDLTNYVHLSKGEFIMSSSHDLSKGARYTVSIRNDLLLSNYNATTPVTYIHTWMVVTNTATGEEESYSLASDDIGFNKERGVSGPAILEDKVNSIGPNRITDELIFTISEEDYNKLTSEGSREEIKSAVLQPLLDANGKQVVEQVLDEEGNPVLGHFKPVYERNYTLLSLGHDDPVGWNYCFF